MRRICKTLIACAVAATILLAGTPAHAADIQLLYCASTAFTQSVTPNAASRNIGSSSNWDPDGFRSCSWQGRWGIRVTCWDGNLVDPELNIVQDTGAHAGARTVYEVPKDGAPHYYWNAQYPYPNDSQSTWYHLHLHQTNVEGPFDATFSQCIIRVGA